MVVQQAFPQSHRIAVQPNEYRKLIECGTFILLGRPTFHGGHVHRLMRKRRLLSKPLTEKISMPRDDFSAVIVRELGRRVGLRCSNPNCRLITTGPHSNEAKSINVGQAAHITAAAAGGKRYDESLSTDERRGIANGIWLCERCAKLIDTDENRYTVAVLQKWKRLAENEALAEIEGTEPKDDPTLHSIRFAVDGWEIWRNRGSLPGDTLVRIDGWLRGDLKYHCTLRLRNDNRWDDHLHSPRMEYRFDKEILFSDGFAVQGEIALPGRKWISVPVSHGCHGEWERQMPNADSIWFAAETVGDNKLHTWKVADLIFDAITLKQ